MTTTKTCITCQAELPIADFNRNKRKKDGYQSKCRACEKAYYQANKETFKKASTRWKKENAERVRAYKKEYRESDPSKVADQYRGWRERNPEKHREREARRRASVKGNERLKIDALTTKRIAVSTCFACGTREDITVEHLIPITRGGRHAIGNLVALCRPCNSSKRELTFAEWKYSGRPRAREVFPGLYERRHAVAS